MAHGTLIGHMVDDVTWP